MVFNKCSKIYGKSPEIDSINLSKNSVSLLETVLSATLLNLFFKSARAGRLPLWTKANSPLVGCFPKYGCASSN